MNPSARTRLMILFLFFGAISTSLSLRIKDDKAYVLCNMQTRANQGAKSCLPLHSSMVDEKRLEGILNGKEEDSREARRLIGAR